MKTFDDFQLIKVPIKSSYVLFMDNNANNIIFLYNFLRFQVDFNLKI